ncbi:MAG: chemotaxis protein CheW [Polyangiaceae bacterium]|nr:chemotaxis protein CheW [Polyangiaceae bacterium]
MPTSLHAEGAGLSAEDLELLRRRAARYARAVDLHAEVRAEVVVFARGAARYALRLSSLREIRPLRSLARIPGTSRVVPGVFHYRGDIVSAHDLDAYMAEEPTTAAPRWVLIAESEERTVGLLADEVDGVEALPQSEVRPPPLTLRGGGAGVEGIAGGEVVVLNLTELLSLPEFARAF